LPQCSGPAGRERKYRRNAPCRPPPAEYPWASPWRGIAAGREMAGRTWLLGGTGIDLVEHAAIAEIFGLRLTPATEILDGDEMQVAEAGNIFRSCRFRTVRAIEVLGSD